LAEFHPLTNSMAKGGDEKEGKEEDEDEDEDEDIS
jgi:hypothetical protein